MKSKLLNSAALIFLIFLLTNISNFSATLSESLDYYFRSIKNGDFASARNFWHSNALKRADRLNIQYNNIPLKIDCASPAILYMEQIQNEIVNWEIGECREIEENFQVCDAAFITGGDTLIQPYYIEYDNNNARLIKSQDVFARDWAIVQTDYVRIHYNDSSLINEYAVKELDHFIDDASEVLEISSGRMELLRSEKIDYYLCNVDDFENITGHHAHGLYVIPSDAIITRHLPHRHELAHFLINYKLETLDLFTIPLLQEGFATAIGGRWEKSNDVILQLGYHLHSQNLIHLDSMLTRDDFYRSGPADMTYPMGGLLVNMIIDELGMKNFLVIYRSLSGTGEEVAGIDSETIKTTIAGAFGWEWTEFLDHFSSYVNKYNSIGITIVDSLPSEEPYFTTEDDYVVHKIWNENETYIIEISSDLILTTFNIFFIDKNSDISPEYRSTLFKDMLADYNSFSGQRYGIISITSDLGVYDFYTNELLAKYIPDFYGSHYRRGADRTHIIFAIDKSLLKKDISEYSIKINWTGT